MRILRQIVQSVIACSIGFTCTAIVWSQSTVISLENGPVAGVSAAAERIPTNIPPQVRKTEEILDSPIPATLRGQIVVKALLRQLKSLGVSATVHESAMDNGFDEDAFITLTLGGQSIATNLRYTFDEFEVGYEIDRAGVMIIRSDDSLFDNLTEVIYDISSFTASPEPIMDNILETIDPDSWEENGGSGRMYNYSNHGRRLLVITSTYFNQREIRRQLNDIAKMSGSTMPIVQLDGFGTLGIGSSVVELPSPYVADRRRQGGFGGGGGGFGGGGFGGGGRGGGGLGGGVF